MPAKTKRIAVMVESHFDPTEPDAFSMFFPNWGYSVDFISNLRGAKQREFKANDGDEIITVSKDLSEVKLSEYAGVLLVGGYCMDMLRYEVKVNPADPTQVPVATAFMRKAFASKNIVIGAICHSLWILTPARELLEGRRVTCGHNIMYDVRNAGAELVYDRKRQTLVDTHVDGRLVTGRHPYVIAEFMNVFLDRLNA